MRKRYGCFPTFPFSHWYVLENLNAFGNGYNCGDWRGIEMGFLTSDTNLHSKKWF